MPTTATPRTYGAKYTARNRLRPRELPVHHQGHASGTTISSGTLNTVKMPVARIDSRTASNVTEPGVNRSRVVLQADERLAGQREVPAGAG